MHRIKILIADDHCSIRAGTRKILEMEEDIEVVGEAGDGEEAVALAISMDPDIVIMDIAMPKLDGIEATKQIKKLCADTSVLILTVLDDEEFIASSIEVGASGYLLKNVRANELVQAVRDVYSKYSTTSGSIAWRVLDRFGEFDTR